MFQIELFDNKCLTSTLGYLLIEMKMYRNIKRKLLNRYYRMSCSNELTLIKCAIHTEADSTISHSCLSTNKQQTWCV